MPPVRFVVVWRSRTTNPQSEYGVYGQRFAADGTRLGAELRLTTGGSGDQNEPAVAVRDGGEFIVVWRDVDVFNPPFRTGIRGQWFDDQGNTVGAEFTVSSSTAGFHGSPAAAFDPDGNLLVVWDNFGQDGDFEGVFGQRFDPAGARVGGEFRVNSYTMFAQQGPAVASAAAGSYMVAWTSFNQDGDDYGVFGDVFRESIRVPARRCRGERRVRGGGDRRNQPGLANRRRRLLRRSAARPRRSRGRGRPMRPRIRSWTARRITARSRTELSATAAPPATVTCWRRRSPPPAPPSTGTRRSARTCARRRRPVEDWTLHVGESFADVPPTSIFYRLTRSSVHFGVVGGCLPGSYCPSQGTNRDAMAVFVLVAREGAGYAPPACVAPPMFAHFPV